MTPAAKKTSRVAKPAKKSEPIPDEQPQIPPLVLVQPSPMVVVFERIAQQDGSELLLMRMETVVGSLAIPLVYEQVEDLIQGLQTNLSEMKNPKVSQLLMPNKSGLIVP